MKLLIISGMPHHVRDGEIVGWGPTVQEIDQLATRFEEIRHVTFLHEGAAPKSALPYRSSRVKVIPLPASGGEHLDDKLDIVWKTPRYLRTIWREAHAGVDLIHIRSPANISMLAIGVLPLIRAPRARWIKYAGNWKPKQPESWSYTLQRWLLAHRWHRGQVTVNGRWPDQPSHIHTFYNPCLTREELEQSPKLVDEKQISSDVRLLIIGRCEQAKGVGRALEILAVLRKEHGLGATLDIVGDGPERAEFECRAVELGVGDAATFHGWMPRNELSTFFARAHIMLFPSSASEGWPKVLSEAMAYGVVPVTSNVSSIPQYLESFDVGKTFAPDDKAGYVAAISEYVRDPSQWKEQSRRASVAAQKFSYENYLKAVDRLLVDCGLSSRAP